MIPAAWPDRHDVSSRLKQALLGLMLLVFGWHALVLQSHVHAPTPASLTPGLHAARASVSGSGDRRLPLSEPCPIEREGVFSGAFLTPQTPTFAAEAPVPQWVDGTCAVAQVHRAPAHDWHSRAPPAGTHRATA